MTAVHTLTLQCNDRPGLVAAVAGCLAANGGNIVDAGQFNDAGTGRFFMRIEFTAPVGAPLGSLRDAFGGLAAGAGMQWKLRSNGVPTKVLIMVSRFDHCLVDLLYRRRVGDLAMDVVAIVGNHARDALTQSLAGDIPYHHLPIEPDTKRQQEAALRALIATTGAELVVLARYMQILSDETAGILSGRCINIHHSFLPGFKGAKPYHQAHARGVKMIGATAHYVTADLDEGPIIHQAVEPITHADTPDDLIRKGRDIERRVLSEAVRLHLEDRVLLNGGKTVVFRD